MLKNWGFSVAERRIAAMGGVLSLTYSKIKCFMQCPKQYWYLYESGLPRPEDVKTIGGMVGTGVHRALARLAFTNAPEDGLAELRAYLAMPEHEPVGPGTAYHDDAFALYERGVEAHRSIASEQAYAEFDGAMLSRQRGIRVWAKVDRADRMADGSWQIIDWKTGRFESGEETDAQLDIYHIVTRTKWTLPHDADVTAIGWNLRTGEKRTRALNRTDAAATANYLGRVADRIRSTEVFEALPGTACRFCRWREQCEEAAASEAFAEELCDYDEAAEEPEEE